MVINNHNIANVFNKFVHGSEFSSYKELTSGHINSTYLITTQNKKNFVLQRINSFVFKYPKQLIQNKVKVSEHIQNQLQHLNLEALNKRVLQFVYAKNNVPYYKDKEDNYWNVTYFIEGSKTVERVLEPKIAYEGGKLFGDFLNLTNNFDTNQIVDILPNFHEMSFRYQQFYEALKNADVSRLKLAQTEINFVENLKEEMHILQNLKNEGKIPLRVTHNDTKISNALFDKNNKGICVIDTDTVMVGIIHYDFGDAVRTICNTAFEDETNLEKVGFNINFYKAFTKGFLKKTYKQLSVLDVENLALAAKTITFIMGLRMLTDFLNNDVYYKTSYKNHNLDRAKNQFKLVNSIAENFEKMNKISLEEYKKLIKK
jgi:serine/threonine protein kinase